MKRDIETQATLMIMVFGEDGWKVLYHGAAGETWGALFRATKRIDALEDCCIYPLVPTSTYRDEGIREAVEAYDGPIGEPLPVICDGKEWLAQQRAVTERVRAILLGLLEV